MTLQHANPKKKSWEDIREWERTYENGKPLSGDLRAIIIDELKQKFNANKENFSVKCGAFSEVSKTFRISNPTVSSIWKKYCMDTRESVVQKPRGRPKKLMNTDLDFIEYLKIQRPSATSASIHAELSSISTTLVHLEQLILQFGLIYQNDGHIKRLNV